MKTARAAEMRAKAMSAVDGERDTPTKEDMEHILDALRELFTDAGAVFPLDMAQTRVSAKASCVQVVEADDNELLDEYVQSAVGKPTTLHRAPGATYLDLRVSRVGLKDATVYVNPTVVVSVYDKDGKRMEEPKETAVGSSDEPQHIGFRNALIQLESSLSMMEERGAAVFLEVYHYKPKKRKKSCRCWALVELDEIRPDATPLALELYQKPMDPRRKRINLFTVKELFLHVEVSTIAIH